MTWWRRGVSIGEDLAGARRRADLTVTQVSKQTCIRDTLIRAIERGDYAVCGGNFYARGHIRAIARVVGADPGPLIAAYDAARPVPQPVPAADLLAPARPVKVRGRAR
jgi:cytoskeletal protein RodZ